MTETFALLSQSSHIFHLQRTISAGFISQLLRNTQRAVFCSERVLQVIHSRYFLYISFKKIRAEVKEHTRSLSCTMAVTRCYAAQRRIIINLLKIMDIHIQTLDLIHLLYCVYKCLICSSGPSIFTYCCFSCFSH